MSTVLPQNGPGMTRGRLMDDNIRGGSQTGMKAAGLGRTHSVFCAGGGALSHHYHKPSQDLLLHTKAVMQQQQQHRAASKKNSKE